ncbi:ribonuclease Z [Geoalkalibacter sp.]|uniref:ribonuclease Z n=1 Tax=Geoalkalibacter sp. TaxID=3041440 RepID=UPI00272DE0B7|nr:MBL fold metallo-hydrolase [Geoalkalibacter sp.]
MASIPSPTPRPGRLPFNFCEPAFFSGLMDDPLLLVQVRPLGRGLLFDCGQLHHLAKRVLRSIDAVFISHAHMDHFMGVDTLVRHVLVSPRTLDFYGPPGIAARFANKLGSYDWNLAEDFWCSFRVHEVHAHGLRTFMFRGPEGFACRFVAERAHSSTGLHVNRYLRVDADLCDHKIPVLIYRITELPGFALDEGRMAVAGLVPGPWIKELKQLFFAGDLQGRRLRIPRGVGDAGPDAEETDAAALYERIRARATPASIGYFTDLGLTPENRRRLKDLLGGVTLLIGECTYLAQDEARARAAHHLCSTDINVLLDELRPAWFLPMHLSKSYLGRSERLFRELEPPAGTTILRLPERLTPRPLIPADLPPAARGRW